FIWVSDKISSSFLYHVYICGQFPDREPACISDFQHKIMLSSGNLCLHFPDHIPGIDGILHLLITYEKAVSEPDDTFGVSGYIMFVRHKDDSDTLPVQFLEYCHY